jgi:hypothetical protein
LERLPGRQRWLGIGAFNRVPRQHALTNSASSQEQENTMKIHKTHLIALALTGAMAVAAVTPSFARDRSWAAAGAGFAAGAIVGAAAANANAGYYYGPGYEPYGYAYAPAPATVYAPGYVYAPGAYAYSPSYNPEQPYDPDPRIGGSVRLNSND